MDLWLEREFKHYKISIEYCDMVDTRGFITKTPRGPVMFLKNGLPEAMENEVALHELGHYLGDDTVLTVSNSKLRTTILQERKAMDYSLKSTLMAYIADNDLSPRDVNPVVFCQSHGYPEEFADSVKEMLAL